MQLPYCVSNVVNHYFCESPSVRSLSCMDTHLIEIVLLVISMFMAAVPLSCIVAYYIRTARSIFKIKSVRGHCKAFFICASHLTVVSLSYAPATYIYMRHNSSYSPEQDKQLSLFHNVFMALLNPVVYSLRYKVIKGAFFKVMGWSRVAW